MSLHLTDDVLMNVPHRQFVFTIPKRLRLYFRYDRSLLSELVHSAWEVVSEIYSEEIAFGEATPAMIAPMKRAGVSTSPVARCPITIPGNTACEIP